MKKIVSYFITAISLALIFIILFAQLQQKLGEIGGSESRISCIYKGLRGMGR
ncbi:MAG: hypothetical protein AB1630_09270 [bacterium]